MLFYFRFIWRNFNRYTRNCKKKKKFYGKQFKVGTDLMKITYKNQKILIREVKKKKKKINNKNKSLGRVSSFKYMGKILPRIKNNFSSILQHFSIIEK